MRHRPSSGRVRGESRARNPLSRMGRGVRKLIQPVLDFVEAGDGAGFVFVPTWGATDGNATDRVFADLDRHATLPSGELAIVHAGIESTRCRDSLREIAGRDPLQGSRIGFAAGELLAHH